MAFIAKASEGGMRDALSIMDQAIAFGDGTLTLQDALNVTGSVHDEALDHLFDDIVQGDVQASFKKYHQFITEGKEVNRLINDMIYFVRDTIMNKTSEKDTEYRALMNLELDMLYQMIDLINDTLVSIRFSVNQNVHFEVLLVKLAEQIKGQPQVIANVAEPAQIASSPNTDVLLQRMEQLEQELKTLKAQGVSVAPTQKSSKKPVRGIQKSKNAFSMQQIAKVLDKANKADIKLLKDHWQEESVVCNIVNKNVKVVGVPSDQWQRVRTEYLQNRKNEGDDMPKQQAQQTDIAQKAKDLFGEETVHVIDEE